MGSVDKTGKRTSKKKTGKRPDYAIEPREPRATGMGGFGDQKGGTFDPWRRTERGQAWKKASDADLAHFKAKMDFIGSGTPKAAEKMVEKGAAHRAAKKRSAGETARAEKSRATAKKRRAKKSSKR